MFYKPYELNKFQAQITQIIQVSNTKATKLESSFQVSQMLDQIILQLLMTVRVSKFLTLGQERGKGSRHLMINICKTALSIVWLNV